MYVYIYIFFLGEEALSRSKKVGDWDAIRLYHDKRWDPAAVALAPKTTEVLRDKLPGLSNVLPYIHHNTEEAARLLIFWFLAIIDAQAQMVLRQNSINPKLDGLD
jgi:hypothetical protein